jgi:hypothetical protein
VKILLIVEGGQFVRVITDTKATLHVRARHADKKFIPSNLVVTSPKVMSKILAMPSLIKVPVATFAQLLAAQRSIYSVHDLLDVE